MNWSAESSYDPRYFFEEGLRFECRQCGACCTGDPGIVRVSPEEIAAIGDFLGLSIHQVESEILHTIGGEKSIREDEKGTCIFYDKGCRIYRVRPRQCKTFPFWVKHLRSAEAWNKAGRECPGIGSGHCFTKGEILSLLR